MDDEKMTMKEAEVMFVQLLRDKAACYYKRAEKQELTGRSESGTILRKLAASYTLTADNMESCGLEIYCLKVMQAAEKGELVEL